MWLGTGWGRPMPVTFVPLPQADIERRQRTRGRQLADLLLVARKLLKDRRYFWRQGEEFTSLAREARMPRLVELETMNKCNSTCAFCPVNRDADPRPTIRMSDDLFRKIVDDLAANDYADQVNLFSNNEPFLDKRIFDFAEYARQRLPRATLQIFTNGTALDPAKTVRILRSIDILRINNYSTTAELHKNVRAIMDHLDREHPALAPKVIVHMRLLDEFKDTRAGNAPNRARFRAVYRSRCAYPFYQMTVRPDGKVSLCCNDALGQETLADLSVQSVREAWGDERRRKLQALMLQGRDKIDMCRGCDNLHTANPRRVAARAFVDQPPSAGVVDDEASS